MSFDTHLMFSGSINITWFIPLRLFENVRSDRVWRRFMFTTHPVFRCYAKTGGTKTRDPILSGSRVLRFTESFGRRDRT